MEQTVKDLQAQNAQFQQMLLAMGKGQEDLKALLLEDQGASLEEDHNVEIDEAEADYSEEQYPPTDDKYNQL